MAVTFPIVDADGHLEENHIDWKERLPDRYESEAPERPAERQRPTADDHRGKSLAEAGRLGHRRRRAIQPAPSAPSGHDRSQGSAGRHG